MSTACLENLPAISGRILHADEDMAPFLCDWRKKWQGSALAVIQPDTASGVAAIVRWAKENRIAVVPQGGNTGLSGGAIPSEDGRSIVLSTARLNRVRSIDLANDSMVVEAGCILHDVQKAASDHGRLFPLALASEGSCTIGGNLATNAGGTGVLRYGNARQLCLGLEVVTSDGAIWDGLTGLRKDNSGYDLRDIFIGSEGTLGIITAATLGLHPQPYDRTAALVAVCDIESALALLSDAKSVLGGRLSAFELFSRDAATLVKKHFDTVSFPLMASADWFVLIENSVDPGTGDTVLEEFLASSLDNGLISDAIISQSIRQFKEFWNLRELISEAQGLQGDVIKHDIALKASSIAQFVFETNSEICKQWPDVMPIVFGHLGDGNLHYNISTRADKGAEFSNSVQEEINRLVHDRVAILGGSISAEHGLGRLRREEILRYKSSVEIDLMRRIKRTFDPDGIFNPGIGFG